METRIKGFYEKVREELRLRNYSHKTIKAYLGESSYPWVAVSLR